jgi:hypothetical protein
LSLKPAAFNDTINYFAGMEETAVHFASPRCEKTAWLRRFN